LLALRRISSIPLSPLSNSLSRTRVRARRGKIVVRIRAIVEVPQSVLSPLAIITLTRLSLSLASVYLALTIRPKPTSITLGLG
jgi:hypothetical protein